MAAPKLPKDVAEKYACTYPEGAAKRGTWAAYGKFDLATISLQEAANLVALGFPYLKAKKNVSAKTE